MESVIIEGEQKFVYVNRPFDPNAKCIVVTDCEPKHPRGPHLFVWKNGNESRLLRPGFPGSLKQFIEVGLLNKLYTFIERKNLAVAKAVIQDELGRLQIPNGFVVTEYHMDDFVSQLQELFRTRVGTAPPGSYPDKQYTFDSHIKAASWTRAETLEFEADAIRVTGADDVNDHLMFLEKAKAYVNLVNANPEYVQMIMEAIYASAVGRKRPVMCYKVSQAEAEIFAANEGARAYSGIADRPLEEHVKNIADLDERGKYMKLLNRCVHLMKRVYDKSVDIDHTYIKYDCAHMVHFIRMNGAKMTNDFSRSFEDRLMRASRVSEQEMLGFVENKYHRVLHYSKNEENMCQFFAMNDSILPKNKDMPGN